MIRITEENYNSILQSGKSILLLLEKENDPESMIAKDTLNRIDQMQGKSFLIGIIDIAREKEINAVLAPESIPAFYFIKNKRISKTVYGIQSENDILNITRA